MNKKKISLILIGILAALLLTSCSAALSGSSWPGISTNGNAVYVANMQYVYAVDSKTGSQVWRYPEKPTKDGKFFAAPVLVDGQLIVGDYKKVLYSLNPSNGSENWTFEAKGPWIADPLVVDGMIYAPNGDGNLYALNMNGELVWKFTAKKALWSHPAGNGDTIYQASMDHFLYAIDMKSGKEKWSLDLGGAVIYSPTLSEDGVIYLTTLARELMAIDSSNGDVLWRRKFEESLWSQPALDGDRLFMGDLSGMAYAISVKDGTDIWSQSLADPVMGKPTVTTDMVYFATENGTMYAMNFDGERQWSKTVEGKLYTGPVLMDDKLLIGVALGESPMVMVSTVGQDVWSFIPPKK